MVNKSAEQWARTNALRERGVTPRGAPTAAVAKARAEREAAKCAAKARRSR